MSTTSILLVLVSSCLLHLSQVSLAYRSSGDNKDVIQGFGQYIFERRAFTWNEALQACREKGGTLVVIDTPQEAKIITGLLRKYEANSIHLGFHNLYNNDIYVTIEGKDVSSCNGNWAPGYPRYNVQNKCGAYGATGYKNMDCNAKQQSICELRLSSDYDFIPGAGFYRYHTEAVTWPEAWKACRAEGTHLIVVYTQGEYNVIKTRYPSTSPVWVGAHRLYGSPVTIFDEPVNTTGYNTWFQQLGEYTAFPYVELQYASTNGGFNAEQPNTRRPFICERRIHLY